MGRSRVAALAGVVGLIAGCGQSTATTTSTSTVTQSGAATTVTQTQSSIVTVTAITTEPRAPAPEYHRCRGGFDTRGNPTTTGDFWGSIRELQTTCAQALFVAHVYVQQTNGDPGSLLGRREAIGDFVCSSSLIQGRDNPYGEVQCMASGGRRVRFDGVS